MHPSIKNILQSSVFILLALAIWEYGSLSGWWRPFLFPAPSAISGYLEEAIRDNSLWAATVVTIRRLLLGTWPESPSEFRQDFYLPASS